MVHDKCSRHFREWTHDIGMRYRDEMKAMVSQTMKSGDSGVAGENETKQLTRWDSIDESVQDQIKLFWTGAYKQLDYLRRCDSSKCLRNPASVDDLFDLGYDEPWLLIETRWVDEPKGKYEAYENALRTMRDLFAKEELFPPRTEIEVLEETWDAETKEFMHRYDAWVEEDKSMWPTAYIRDGL